jgi:hypothetical protein
MRLADAAKVDKYTWTITLYLAAQDVKFRASDSWDTNWGETGFPDGTGVQNGPNIHVPTAGFYKVTFNDATGAYTFTALSGTAFTTIGIIGTATPGGWDSDTNLEQDANDPHVWAAQLTLAAGEAKFRANDDWGNNWGSDTYPSGYGIGNGPNIAVPVGGTYFIRFNDVTGEYSFMAIGNSNPYTTVGLIGPAQPGGWDSDTDLIKNPANPFLWSKSVTITESEAKFRANDAWDVNWGASAFPGGVAIQNGANIPTKAGTYFVTFNSGTGEYYFLK